MVAENITEICLFSILCKATNLSATRWYKLSDVPSTLNMGTYVSLEQLSVGGETVYWYSCLQYSVFSQR